MVPIDGMIPTGLSVVKSANAYGSGISWITSVQHYKVASLT